MYRTIFFCFLLLFAINFEVLALSKYSERHFTSIHESSLEGDFVSLRSNNRDFVGYEFEPGFEPGFNLAYSFKTTKTKSFFVSWFYFNYKTTGSIVDEWTSHLGSRPASISHDYHQTLNIINLGLNDSIAFKKKMVLNYFGGIQYVNIKNSILYQWAYNSVQASGSVFAGSNAKGVGGILGLNFEYQYSSHVGLNIQGTYSTIYLLSNTSENTQEFIDRVTVPNITSSTKLRLKNDTVVGGQGADASLHYDKKIDDGTLSIKIGWMGIAYGKFADRWEVTYLGLVWTE